jgi:hypothetical protein
MPSGSRASSGPTRISSGLTPRAGPLAVAGPDCGFERFFGVSGRGDVRRRVMSEHERAAGQYPAACRAQNCALSKCPVRPGYGRLALGERRERIKTAVPSKEQTSCCGADTIPPVSTSAFPVRALANGIEPAHDVQIERPHHADTGELRWTAERCDQDQRFPLRYRLVEASAPSLVTFQ